MVSQKNTDGQELTREEEDEIELNQPNEKEKILGCHDPIQN